MISAKDLRQVQLTTVDSGYSVDEVNAVLDKAAETITAYENENKELYRKMEVLASKIEEYRTEEDSIKTALVTAQKMADKIKQEATDEAEALRSKSNADAQSAVTNAKEKAEKIVSEARQYASSLLKEKTEEANTIVSSAEKKANDAIGSSKIVAQNILDQAKEISDDLISKSKEEKEAYDILITSLKGDAAAFIENVKELYTAQLEKLQNAKLEADNAQEDEVESIHSEVNSLVSEIQEIQEAIPEEISIEKTEAPAEEDDFEEIEEEDEEPEEELFDEDDEEDFDDEEDEEEPEVDEAEDEPGNYDPMAAVKAFSQDEITPIDTTRRIVPEIDEEPPMEKSLFDNEEKNTFENYFNVNKTDAHFDKTQQISLVPPEDDDDDEPKFKGFFKKKK